MERQEDKRATKWTHPQEAALTGQSSWAPQQWSVSIQSLQDPTGTCFLLLHVGSSRQHQCTHPETVKQIQWSEACFYNHIANHTFIRVAYKIFYIFLNQSQITTNLFKLESKHKYLRWSHAGVYVEWRCIQSVAVRVVYTPDESFSKHAIRVLLHLVLACVQAIPTLMHAVTAALFGHVSAGIALILACTRAVNP